MTRAVRRLGAVLAAALVVSFALSACVGIPSSGGVNVGIAVGKGDDPSFGDVAHGPRRDSSKSDILTDFMQAATSPAGDYAIAKEFLTRAAARSWNPNKSVVIREGSATSSNAPGGSIDYVVSTKSSVTADGVYSEDNTPTTPTQTLNYGFTKVAGQWRISSLRDQTVISRSSFERVFAPHPIYFFDPSFHYLVPDVRWFPTGSTVQTRIVSALLGGPPEYLQSGAVATAFPAGTTLEQPVVLARGTATVDLSTEATAGTKPTDRARMNLQLSTSLRSTSVTAVSISVHGAPLVVGGFGGTPPAVAVAVDSAPLIRLGKRFGFAPSIAPIARLTAQIIAIDGTAVTLARSQASAAVLAKTGVYLVTNSSNQPQLVDARPKLIAPSIDTEGFVWSVPGDDASAIRAIGADGIAHAVQSMLPRAAPIVSLAVSHDGARLLVYLRTTTGPKLEVAGILRNASGVPTGLGTPLLLPVGPFDPIDAAWVDDETVAALGAANGEDTVVPYVIGGTAGDPATTTGAVSIAGGSTIDDLRLLNVNDQVQQLRPSGWQNIGVRASLLGTQQ